uniref:Glycosyltransferase n=1 Tax=Setaria italica TaxID=4555 RepID=K4AKZ1_SETIT
MTQKSVILYPSLGVGHLNPMVELAKLFLRRGLAVVITVVDSPDKDSVLADAIARLAAANPDIAFHLLPVPSCGREDYPHAVMRIMDVMRVANPALREFLMGALPDVEALVLDMFCADALDVAAELGIPSYFFFASALGYLAIMLRLPEYYPAAPSPIKDMPETVLHFPGVPPIRALDMAATLQDRDSDIAKARLAQCTRMLEARGILVNSFDRLESRALEALRCGLCTPRRSTPSVHCIGSLVLPGNTGGISERHACLEWLDTQPDRSVVFLREMARGLENSGQRFLWVVRNPPEHQSNSAEPDLGSLLPEGFLERTRERGFVVKNWAPQSEVLRHPSIEGFAMHCGWNSALEGIASGVPMICWPLYAEQRMNKVLMVEEMKVGVVMEGYEEELVKAEEVETKVRLVMASDEGEELRQRVMVAKEMAVDALKTGASSDVAFDEFLTDLQKSRTSTEKRAT